MDHTDDGLGYLGASHQACNRATSKRRAAVGEVIYGDGTWLTRYASGQVLAVRSWHGHPTLKARLP